MSECGTIWSLVDAEIGEGLRLPGLLLDQVDVQVVLAGIDGVDEVFELTSHEVAFVTKEASAGERSTGGRHSGLFSASLHLSGVKPEWLGRSATKYKHISVADLDASARLRADEIWICYDNLRPRLTSHRSSIVSIHLILNEEVRGASIEALYDERVLPFTTIWIITWHNIDEPLIHHDGACIDQLDRHFRHLEPVIRQGVICFAKLGHGGLTDHASQCEDEAISDEGKWCAVSGSVHLIPLVNLEIGIDL